MSGDRKRRKENRVKQALVSLLAGGVNRIVRGWCRHRTTVPTYHERRRRGESVRCIYAAWHGYLWHGTKPLEGQGNVVMVSSHRDGEIIARMLGRRGFRLVRGSSTRGGARALRDFAKAAREGETDLVVTIDGPKGPARVAKPGVLYTASLTGLPIVPMGMWIDRAWRLKSWDRLLVGKPFARVVIAYGDEIHVPRGLDRDELEGAWRERLEAAMVAVEEDARRCATT